MKEEERKIYNEATKQWGISSQVIVCFEECGELINALAKKNRGRATDEEIITELADVSIMVDQMALIFGEDKYINERERKIQRLKERLTK